MHSFGDSGRMPIGSVRKSGAANYFPEAAIAAVRQKGRIEAEEHYTGRALLIGTLQPPQHPTSFFMLSGSVTA
jgi:hypothetical protein